MCLRYALSTCVALTPEDEALVIQLPLGTIVDHGLRRQLARTFLCDVTDDLTGCVTDVWGGVARVAPLAADATGHGAALELCQRSACAVQPQKLPEIPADGGGGGADTR